MIVFPEFLPLIHFLQYLMHQGFCINQYLLNIPSFQELQPILQSEHSLHQHQILVQIHQLLLPRPPLPQLNLQLPIRDYYEHENLQEYLIY